MYIDGRIRLFDGIAWSDISTHRYERVSRTQWRIKIELVCGAHMTIENIPDDLIQCLVLGAFNCGKRLDTNVVSGILRGEAEHRHSLTSWPELQTFILAAASVKE